MVFNNEVLFLHLGKTGGMSVTNYLCNVLKPPVIQVVKAGEFEIAKPSGYEVIVPWKRHANLVETVEFLEQKGISLLDFKLIFCVVRNPLDLDYSFYKHLNNRKYFKKLSANPANKHLLSAAQDSYDYFARQNFTHYKGNLKDFFEIEGKMPENMKIVRFEELSTALPELIKPYANKDVPFPHLNKSAGAKNPRSLIGREALLSIGRKYDYIFKNYYSSIMPLNNEVTQNDSEEKKFLFIAGCGRSGTSALTTIIGSHARIALGLERYNKLMKKSNFLLTREHFTKERFLNVQMGDTQYSDFSRHLVHHNISEKWDQCKLVGVKYPPADIIYSELKKVFGDFYYIFIYRNIFDVAESWNRKAASEAAWPAEKNYIKAVKRWNLSLQKTLHLINMGEPIICVKYEDLFFSDKPLDLVFKKLGLPIDENVLEQINIARGLSSSKKEKKGQLSKEEYDFVASRARFDLFETFDKYYNIFKSQPTENIEHKPELMLHIGTEKTGTTSIQEFLHINRGLLMTQGIAFLKSPGNRNHRNLVLALIKIEKKKAVIGWDTPDEREKSKKKLLENFHNEIKSLPDHINKVIISSEHFSSLIKDKGDLFILREFFNDYFSSIKIIVYLRRQDEIALSRLSTSYLFDFAAKQSDFEILRNNYYYNYFRLLNMWEDGFPEAVIIPRIFDRNEFIANDLINDFMWSAGIKQKADFKIPERLNQSLSKSAIDAAMLMDGMAENGQIDLSTDAAKALKKEIIQTINLRFPGEGKEISKHTAIDFCRKFSSINQQVAKKWFLRDQLFSEDFSMYPEIPENSVIDPDVAKVVLSMLEGKSKKREDEKASKNKTLTRPKRISWLKKAFNTVWKRNL